MTRTTRITSVLCILYLLPVFAISGAAQSARIAKQPYAGWNVSGTISWQEYKAVAKNCTDLRIVISEQKGVTTSGPLRLPKYEILGYQYATPIANQSDCSYRVKLQEGKPLSLSVEWTGQFLYPVGSTVVRGTQLGWKNPITVKPGETLVRDFKMVVTEIH